MRPTFPPMLQPNLKAANLHDTNCGAHVVHLGKTYRAHCAIPVTCLKAGSLCKIKSLREPLRSPPNLTRGSSAVPRPLAPLRSGTDGRVGSQKSLNGAGAEAFSSHVGNNQAKASAGKKSTSILSPDPAREAVRQAATWVLSQGLCGPPS